MNKIVAKVYTEQSMVIKICGELIFTYIYYRLHNTWYSSSMFLSVHKFSFN